MTSKAVHILASSFQRRRYVFATLCHGHEESALAKMPLPLEVLHTVIAAEKSISVKMERPRGFERNGLLISTTPLLPSKLGGG
jgi:hypothetical protein